MSALTFHYKMVDSYWRPIILIEVIYKRSSIKHEVLIDSGADYCIFNAEIGEVLGIDIEKGDRLQFKGIDGVKQIGYSHRIGINAKGITYNAIAVFSYDIADMSCGIVGQLYFFDHFKINFDYQKASIVLRPK